jgi:DNA-directed RNA polymerase III subunit RPC8
MFLLVERQDIIVIKPEYFGDNLEDVIKYLINEKYSNNILQDVGLVISLYDVVQIDESQIYQGEGSAYTTVRFRLLVFGPFVGEVLQGTIYKQDGDGIVVALYPFFDHVYIQASQLPTPCVFDGKEWIWKYKGIDFVLFTDDIVNFKVYKTEFINKKQSAKRTLATVTSQQETILKYEGVSPSLSRSITRPRSRSVSFDTQISSSNVGINGTNVTNSRHHMYTHNESCMKIHGRMNEPGLGIVGWWRQEGDDE